MEMVKLEIAMLFDATEKERLQACYNAAVARGYTGDFPAFVGSLVEIGARANVMARIDQIMNSLK